jgi:hypothetical protein
MGVQQGFLGLGLGILLNLSNVQRNTFGLDPRLRARPLKVSLGHVPRGLHPTLHLCNQDSFIQQTSNQLPT